MPLNISPKTVSNFFPSRSTICSSMAANPTSVKLRKLELKITKNDDDVIRFRREIFLEELKGEKCFWNISFICLSIISSFDKIFVF